MQPASLIRRIAVAFRQTKMKAGDARPELEDKAKPFFVECRDRFFRLRHGPQSKFIEIGCKPTPHACRRLRIDPRVGVDEKVKIKRAVGHLAQCRDLLARDFRREHRATDRAQRPGITHCRR
jgi:hypothetical protein